MSNTDLKRSSQGEQQLAVNFHNDPNPPTGLLRKLKLHSPFATLRAKVLLGVWALVTLGILSFVLVSDLNRAEASLDTLGNLYFQHVSDRALISETAIEGFAVLIDSMDAFDHGMAKEYADKLLQRYPFLYMFEVAQRVTDTDRPAFETEFAAEYPGFYVKRFSYESDRAWRPAEHAPFYYPLVFQDPMLKGENLIGLDIHSSEFLKLAMETSFERGEAVATQPFELAEGGRGYVLHRAVEYIGERPPSAFEADTYVLLAVQSHSLFPDLMPGSPRVGIQLVHRDFDDSRGMVLSIPATPVTRFEEFFFPYFEKALALGINSQPFVLRVKWQLGWGDLSLPPMVGVILGSLLMFLGVRAYAQLYIRSELTELENEGTLYQLANFDPLTALANRNRIVDFLESALARARRHKHRCIVLFIDLDGFKNINDTHGHTTGDLVLIEVAKRLSAQLRDDELLGRYGGDEFVWVTAGVEDMSELEPLIQRLRASFRQPVVAKGTEFDIAFSIGRAIYPDDGKNISALFDLADESMYRDKRKATSTA